MAGMPTWAWVMDAQWGLVDCKKPELAPERHGERGWRQGTLGAPRQAQGRAWLIHKIFVCIAH